MTADAVVALAVLAVVALGVVALALVVTRRIRCRCPPWKRVRQRAGVRIICVRCGGDVP